MNLYALLLIAALYGCTKPLPLPDIKQQNRIVLLGELIANDTVYLRGGQSISIAAGSSMKFDIPSQLTVLLTDTAHTTSQLHSTVDDYTYKLNTLPYHAPKLILPGNKYLLEAFHPRMGSATCSVTVPPAFIALIADTASVFVNGLHLLRVRIEIIDDPNRSNHYTIEAVKQFMDVDGIFEFNNQQYTVSQNKAFYDSLRSSGTKLDVKWDTLKKRDLARINIYTDDEKTENLKIGNAQSAARRILLDDKLINGQIYTTQVFLDKALFRADSDTARGQILLRVRSVSGDYFDYLKGYELFEPSGSFNSIAQPVEIPGNVKNGIGVVGGVYQHQFRYIYDTWYK